MTGIFFLQSKSFPWEQWQGPSDTRGRSPAFPYSPQRWTSYIYQHLLGRETFPDVRFQVIDSTSQDHHLPITPSTNLWPPHVHMYIAIQTCIYISYITHMQIEIPRIKTTLLWKPLEAARPVYISTSPACSRYSGRLLWPTDTRN